MIISFGFNGAGGGGGTSDYSQLSNKPSINGVTLSGNKTSQDLGITSEVLEPVSSIPSGASAGDVYAINRSAVKRDGVTDGEGNFITTGTGNTYVIHTEFFDKSDTAFATFTTPNNEFIAFRYNTDEFRNFWVNVNDMYTWGVQPGDETFLAASGLQDLMGMYVNYKGYDLVISFWEADESEQKVDVPYNMTYTGVTLTQDESARQVVQVDASGQTGYWEIWAPYQDRFEQFKFIMTPGFVFPAADTIIGEFNYYDVFWRLRSTGIGVAFDISVDSGSTWGCFIYNPAFEQNIRFTDIYATGTTSGKQFKVNTLTCEKDNNGNTFFYINCKACWTISYQNYNGVSYTELMKEGASYNSLSDKPQINGVDLTGNKSASDLGLTSNELLAKEGSLYQKELNGLAVSSYDGIRVFSVDWDGESDMLLSLALQNYWGITANTPYYSGGTWYNITGMRDYPDADYGGLYSCGYSNGKFVCEFNSDFTITGTSVGSITSAVTFYKDVNTQYGKGDVVNLRYENAHSDDWITFISGASRNAKVTNSTGGVLAVNYGNNLQESIEIDSSGEYVDTTGWTLEDDHYFKYTPDMGKLMIFHYGDFYWEIRGGNENLYINNPDVNGIAGDYKMKEYYNSMVGPYIYNGFFWEKLV